MSACIREREREREHWKEGQGIECVESKSIQWLWDQITFVAHTLSKSAPCLLLNIIIYWPLGTPTSRKFTINEMQKLKFKILSDLEKTEIPIYYTEAKNTQKNYWRDRNSSELEGASQNCIHFDIFYQNIPGQKVEHGINIRIRYCDPPFCFFGNFDSYNR